jgi:ABC-type branched-subunit amino acid transport system substrate-binding protein
LTHKKAFNTYSFANLRTTHPLFIRTTRSIPLYGIGLARWITEHPIVQGRKPRWVCIHLDYAYGVGVCDGFKRAYGQVGEEIGRVPVRLKQVNMKREILQLAKLKPDFALAVLLGGEFDVFVRDYYRFKVHENIPVVSTGAIAVPTRLLSYEKTLGKYGTGVSILNAVAYVAEIENPVNQRFVTQYQQTYGALPNQWAMWAYDGGRLLVKALIKLQGKWDGTKVVEYIKTLSYIIPVSRPKSPV